MIVGNIGAGSQVKGRDDVEPLWLREHFPHLEEEHSSDNFLEDFRALQMVPVLPGTNDPSLLFHVDQMTSEATHLSELAQSLSRHSSSVPRWCTSDNNLFKEELLVYPIVSTRV